MMLNDIHEITIYEVEKVREIFLEELSNNSSLHVDMTSITKIDMVGIQLLLSLVQTASDKSIELNFSNVHENVLHEINLCHCQEALGLTDG